MTETELKKVTIRGAGKCHRGALRPDGRLVVICSCPGSANGKLKNQCVVIADGWERANCGH